MNPTKIALFAAALLLPASQALAGERSQKEVKLLNDSAAALSSSRPDLSNRLTQYASKKSDENEESDDRAETADRQDIKTLREASAALKESRPDLSKGLQKCANEKERAESTENKGAGAPYGY